MLTFPNAWKPKSVNWWHPATSSVFNSGLFWANDVSVWSVSSTHFDTHNFCKFKHVSLIFWMDTSVILCDSKQRKETIQIILQDKNVNVNVKSKWITCAIHHNCANWVLSTIYSMLPNRWPHYYWLVYILCYWIALIWGILWSALRRHFPLLNHTMKYLSPINSVTFQMTNTKFSM